MADAAILRRGPHGSRRVRCAHPMGHARPHGARRCGSGVDARSPAAGRARRPGSEAPLASVPELCRPGVSVSRLHRRARQPRRHPTSSHRASGEASAGSSGSRAAGADGRPHAAGARRPWIVAGLVGRSWSGRGFRRGERPSRAVVGAVRDAHAGAVTARMRGAVRSPAACRARVASRLLLTRYTDASVPAWLVGVRKRLDPSERKRVKDLTPVAPGKENRPC
jgi:hypothetical protein